MITWKLFTLPCDGPDDLLEVCEINAPRLTKRIYDMMVMSMRYEAPDHVMGQMFVDGQLVCAVFMIYERMPGGCVKRQVSMLRGNDAVIRYSIHADGERWC